MIQCDPARHSHPVQAALPIGHKPPVPGIPLAVIARNRRQQGGQQ
jgi:hypothetical protein